MGIGPEIDEAELEKIAGQMARVYRVATYNDISKLKQKIQDELGQCYNPLGKCSNPLSKCYDPLG